MEIKKGFKYHIRGADGREYIDFTSGGIFAAILGNEPGYIIHEKYPQIVSTYGHTNPWTQRYIDQLKEFTGYESVALFTTGAEATEAFWRVCRVYNGKIGIWGGLVDPDETGTDNPQPDAMHGWTMGALVMAGKLTDPYSWRFGQAPESTGGMIMEPYHAPSGQFHKIDPTINRIKSLQKEFPDIPLCIDEIQGGFGRTGKMFAHQWYGGLKPYFLTIGKAMGAGYPVSALLGPKEIMESETVIKNAHLQSTHSGHPLMCAIGSYVIEQIQEHNLINESNRNGVFLKDQLTGCGVRFHAGRGLMAGLEFENKDEAERATALCQEKGLLVVNTDRKWVKIGPALIMPERLIERGCKIIKEVCKEILNGA